MTNGILVDDRVDVRIAMLLGLLGCLYCVLYNLFKKPLYTRMEKYKEDTSNFFGKYYDSMASITFIKNHSITDVYEKRLDRMFNDVLKSLLSYQKIQMGIIGCDGILTAFSNLIIYLLGGITILAGNATIGTFTVVLNLFAGIISNIKFFLNYGKVYQETLVSFNRIREILFIKVATNGEKKIDTIENIKLDKITFLYDEKIINEFTYEFKRGNIYINGLDIKEVDMYYLRSKIMGISEQETYLISDTIYNNLTLFKKDNEKMDKYAERLALLPYIKKSEKGYDTEINIQQNNLSGGEKQKIAIIRQLLLNPDVMIFDEPMASLEPNSKVVLKKIFEEIKKDKIIIVVTHDVSLLDENDIVINMGNMSVI